MSDVKYTSRSFDAYSTPQPLVTPKSPPPPPPEHLYLPPLPQLESTSITHSFDTENSTFANNTPDSRNISSSSYVSTQSSQQQQTSPPLNDHHHENGIVPSTIPSTTTNTTGEDESDSVVNSTGLSRAFSLSSFNRDENEPEELERPKVISISTSNPSHLFWVPAAQHPEIAPNEFEKFLQNNAMAKRERSSLKRRSSILSVSFTASDAEKQEQNEGRLEGENRNDALQALERGYQPQQQNRHEFLNMNELQDNDSQHQLQNNFRGDEQHMEGPKQRKARLRRSLSLDTATAAENQMRVPDFLVFDRNSSPLDQSRVLVPKADRPSLLRRGARTKFQRNSSFTPPSARQQVDRHRQAESMPPGAYIERFDHTALDEGVTLSDGPLVEPPLDFTLPFADSVSSSSSPPPLPPMHQHEQSDFNSSFTSRPMERRASAEELPRLQQHHASSPTPTIEIKQLESGQNRVTQESAPLGHTVHEHSQKQSSHQQQLQQQHQHQRKQQQHLDTASPIRPSSERKSAWSWGFKRSKSEQVRGDHHGDKVHIQAETVPRPRPSVSTEASSNTNNTAMTTPSVTTTPSPPPTNSNGKEKESGKRSFGLSSLFSRKNTSTKGQQASTAASTTATSSTAPMAPKDFQLNRINQNRLPIHIERAIYRLSHSKLANPRRPLHEQVLISNLMFWYLSLVSSHQSQQQQQQQQQAGNGTAPDNKARKFVNAGKKGKRRPPSPSNNSNSPRPPSSQHQQQAGHDRPTSPSNTAESRISYQQQQQKNRSPHNPKHHAQQQQQQQENGNVALHQFMGTSRDSTGFVVPENYLKPQQQGSKGMSGVGRRSSLSDSEDDDDDGDEEEGAMSDSSSDDEPSNNNVTMKARAAAATKHRTSNDLVPNHAHITKQKGDDDVPLAMYRKGKA